MPSQRQKNLAFMTKHTKVYKIKGRGLIHNYHHNSIDERFKKMTISGTGTTAHKHMGGTIRHHNRPYELKDVAENHNIPKHKKNIAPIVFKL